MSNNPMLTVRKDFERISADTLKRFEGLPLGWVCDSNGRQGALGGGIRPICCTAPFVGTAFPVACASADNLGLHVALKFAKPGDVLVVAGDEFDNCAVTGDLMVGMAKNTGVAAVVTDTCVRDRDGLEEIGIPIFARGITPNGPYKNGPGSVGMPISIGGHIVEAGDLIVGDRDNVAIVKQSRIGAVLEELESTRAKETGVDGDIAAGKTYQSLADDALQSLEVHWVD
jgi:4-hydroxy-4-methyl-2-oxoglutarate aldolase